MRILPMGTSAMLVEDPPGDPARWSIELRTLGLHGVVDVVPAVRTVLVRCSSEAALEAVVDRLHRITSEATRPDVPEPILTIPVRYDGDDLAEVAAVTGLGTGDVVELHASAEYEVAFCGFAPGFGYLRGLPAPLHLPRRATPRTRVPAGSVAIAAEYSAVYPGASPGGWHLLGTTDVRLFDVDADPPALLRPGRRVRFEPR